jgi:hypothetical protein
MLRMTARVAEIEIERGEKEREEVLDLKRLLGW